MRGARLTQLAILVNVVLFGAMLLDGAGLVRPDPLVHIAWGSNFAPLTVAGEWWRLGSSLFIHFGAAHLLFNAWALWVVGGLVERLFGPLRFATVYLGAGLCGGLASIAWNPLVNSAGASGAIFGLLGAQLAFFLRSAQGIPAEVVRAERASTLAFIGYSVVFGFIAPGIDNAAHLGGLAAGFAIGSVAGLPLGAGGGGRSGRAAATGLVAAVALVAATLAAATWSSGRHAPEQAYLRTWKWYVGVEPALAARTNAVMADARARKIDDATVAARLASEVVPGWDEAMARLEAVPLPADSPLAGERARLFATVSARAEGFRLMAEAIEENDRVKMERSVARLDAAARLSGAEPDR